MIKLSEKTFNAFRDLIYDHAGIHLSDAKLKLVESRISKRLLDLDMNSFESYLEKINKEGPRSHEFQHFLNALSTNETYFFRENKHFDYILGNFPKALPAGADKKYRIWCSAASTGEEPYTLSFVFSELKQKFGIDFQMLATDINTDVLKVGHNGIYNGKALEKIPNEMHKKYLLKPKDSSKNIFKVKEELRNKIKFGKFNLIQDDLSSSFVFDVVFCRNVLIYFDAKTKDLVIGKLLKHLRVGGLLFIGHSETLVNSPFPLEQVIPTVYRKLK